MSSSSSSQGASDPFSEDVVQAVMGLRRAFASLLSSLSGASTNSPTQLGRLLKIDTKLAWKITNFVNETDPFGAALFVPRTAAIKQFLKAAGSKGVAQNLLDDVLEAGNAFDAMAKRHGGDRRSAEMMFAGHSTKNSARILQEHLRNAYRANSVVWGLQTSVLTHGLILKPNASDPPMLDIVTLKGFLGLCYIRPNVSWRIQRMMKINSRDGVANQFERNALDEEGRRQEGGPAWIREFCSQPLPECDLVEQPDGTLIYQLRPGAVGSTGMINCVMGEQIYAMTPGYADGEGRTELNFAAHVTTPTETFVFDIWIHKSIEFGERSFKMFSAMFIRTPAEAVDADEILSSEDVTEFPVGMADPVLLEDPRWGDVMVWSFEKLDQDIRDYRLVRLKMSYPPTPTIPVITFKLVIPEDKSLIRK